MSAPPPLPIPPHSDPVVVAIVAQLQQQIETQAQQLQSSARELEYARLKIQMLEEHLRLRRIAKYGPGSEKLSNLPLQLLEEEPGVSNQEVQAESEREALPAPDGEKKRQRRAHPGRRFPRICRAWRRSSLAQPSSACAESAARKRK